MNKKTIFTEINQLDKELSFDDLFLELYPALVGFGQSFTDKETAKDIVQEVFIKFWGEKNKSEISSIRAYLFRMVHNAVLNRIRHSKVHLKYTAMLKMNALSFIEDHLNDRLDKFNTLEKDRIVEEAMVILPEKCRLILMMHFYQNLSRKCICELLNISISTVDTQIWRGLSLLKSHLNR